MRLFYPPYNENMVISQEYTGPLNFDITGVDCISTKSGPYSGYSIGTIPDKANEFVRSVGVRMNEAPLD